MEVVRAVCAVYAARSIKLLSDHGAWEETGGKTAPNGASISADRPESGYIASRTRDGGGRSNGYNPVPASDTPHAWRSHTTMRPSMPLVVKREAASPGFDSTFSPVMAA